MSPIRSAEILLHERHGVITGSYPSVTSPVVAMKSKPFASRWAMISAVEYVRRPGKTSPESARASFAHAFQ
ncbi:hypothetical protein [Arthrobacter sp.]|uniref:hypothetical protein n=1 Tax=Arthrobacter sp. TaxID=1667 RepID=UPI002811D7B7|nr:hypothetical protein [Arthrobacter sp.]